MKCDDGKEPELEIPLGDADVDDEANVRLTERGLHLEYLYPNVTPEQLAELNAIQAWEGHPPMPPIGEDVAKFTVECIHGHVHAVERTVASLDAVEGMIVETCPTCGATAHYLVGWDDNESPHNAVAFVAYI